MEEPLIYHIGFDLNQLVSTHDNLTSLASITELQAHIDRWNQWCDQTIAVADQRSDYSQANTIIAVAPQMADTPAKIMRLPGDTWQQLPYFSDVEINQISVDVQMAISLDGVQLFGQSWSNLSVSYSNLNLGIVGPQIGDRQHLLVWPVTLVPGQHYTLDVTQDWHRLPYRPTPHRARVIYHIDLEPLKEPLNTSSTALKRLMVSRTHSRLGLLDAPMVYQFGCPVSDLLIPHGYGMSITDFQQVMLATCDGRNDSAINIFHRNLAESTNTVISRQGCHQLAYVPISV